MKRTPVVLAALLLLAGCGEKEKKRETPAPDGGKKPETAAAKESPPKTETAPAEKKSEPAPVEKKAVASDKADEAVDFTFGRDVKRTVRVPKAWKTEALEAGKRSAQVRVPKEENDSEDGDIGISRMRGAGGIEANIPRWVNQFGGGDAMKLKRALKTASGEEAAVAELEGAEYRAMTGGGVAEPKKGWKMIAAVIVAKDGEYYFKFAAPYNTVEANKAAFDRMIESFK